MGLDMYLSKKHYVKNWEHTPPDRIHKITIMKGDKPSTIPVDKICYIETTAMYWRKCNQIHGWFVKNAQNGVDDCGTYRVDREQLMELLNLVTQVIKSSKLKPGQVINGYEITKKGVAKPILEKGKVMSDTKAAEKLLPVQKGFFFGGSGYDQYYYDDLKYTEKGLREILAAEDDGEFYYHASW